MQLISIALSAGGLSAAEALARIETKHPLMGMDFRFVVYSDDEAGARAACDSAAMRISEIEATLSDYKMSSELMRLPREAVEKPIEVSAELFTVLSASLRMHALTGGAFDITVGPYSMLWRQSWHRRRVPDADALKSSATRVGSKFMMLDKERKTVQLARHHMRLDAGGVAKGYALDEALKVLRSKGFQQVMIRAGGDLVTGAAPPGRKGWLLKDGITGQHLEVANCAVATSGDSMQGLEVEGTLYSHIIDPRSGYGVTNRCQAIVISERAMDADMRASSLCVLGLKDGLKLARAQNWTAHMSARRTNENDSSVATEGFSRYHFKTE